MRCLSLSVSVSLLSAFLYSRGVCTNCVLLSVQLQNKQQQEQLQQEQQEQTQAQPLQEAASRFSYAEM